MAFAQKIAGVFNCWMSMLGPIFVAIAVSLLTFCIYTYFTLIYPHFVGFEKLFHSFMAVLLMFNLFFNYFQVITVSPGYPPQDITELGLTEEKLNEIKNAPAPAKGEGWSNWCRHCDKPKPERAHHCHVCGTCVLRMDHHCPWITNCVGFGNHRYFVLFMFWLWISCSYIAFVTSTSMWAGRGIPRHYYILLSFFLSISVFIALGFLLGWHMYLAFSAQTTIEFLNNKIAASEAKKRGQTYRNPYDFGYVKNFKLFFGTGNKWWLFWIPSLKPPSGDGITYKTRADSPISNL